MIKLLWLIGTVFGVLFTHMTQ